MEHNLLQNARWQLGQERPTAFINANGVYQDGTVPFARDAAGTLWAISGHTHMGHIGVFRGSCLEDMAEAWPLRTLFATGGAPYAFDGVRYPEGVLPRGSIWPFGLYICPTTNRFFCFFHNETGWNAHGTGYVVDGPGDGEPDFRHVGLMHSDDCGRTWAFDRWVLTAQQVCFSGRWVPDDLPLPGQPPQGETCLGCGDFSLFDDPHSDYLYLFYTVLYYDSDTGRYRYDGYTARTRRRTDGVMGDFVKYHQGAFCEAGNLGAESPIVPWAWHQRVVWAQQMGCYLLSSVRLGPQMFRPEVMELRTSHDLLHWSEPVTVPCGEGAFGSHYVALVPTGAGSPVWLKDNAAALLYCDNGTDVLCRDLSWTV